MILVDWRREWRKKKSVVLRSPRKTPVKIVQRSHIWAYLPEESDRKRIGKYLSFWKEWYEKEERKAKLVQMVSEKGWMFAGFIPYLQGKFILDLRKSFEEKDIKMEERWSSQVIDPRPYQNEALSEIIAKKRGIISMPTGLGKTTLAAMTFASAPHARGLFICHTKDIFSQAHEEFETLIGRPIGMVGDGKKMWNKRTVGMIQSLRSYIAAKNPLDIIIIDEAHHAPADTYRDLLKKVGCSVRIGLTGTTRPDEEGFYLSTGLLGPTIYDYSYQRGVEEGYLSQAFVRFLRPEIDFATAQEKYFRKVYQKGIVEHEDRNRLIVREAGFLADQGKSVLIQVKALAHGEILESMLEGRADYVHGGTSSEQRNKVKTLLNSKMGKLIVISSPIWDEGVNIPTLDAIIIASGGRSEIKAVQKVGRGLRKTDEKESVTIIDFWDMSHTYLKRHSKERMKVYEEKGWIIKREFSFN
jgi:superfamily II DNA or RNA helicase